MDDANAKARDELSNACDNFRSVVIPAIRDYKRGPTIAGKHNHQIRSATISGGISYNCSFDTFLQFIESMCNVDSLTNDFSKAREGINFTIREGSLERRVLKAYKSTIDLPAMLEVNIRENSQIAAPCKVILQALRDTQLLEKLDRFVTTQPPPNKAPIAPRIQSNYVPPPPTLTPKPKQVTPEVSSSFLFKLATADNSVGHVSLNQRSQLHSYAESLERLCNLVSKRVKENDLPDHYASSLILANNLIAAIRILLHDGPDRELEPIIALDSTTIQAALKASHKLNMDFMTQKILRLKTAEHPLSQDIAQAELGLNLIEESIKNLSSEMSQTFSLVCNAANERTRQKKNAAREP